MHMLTEQILRQILNLWVISEHVASSPSPLWDVHLGEDGYSWIQAIRNARYRYQELYSRSYTAANGRDIAVNAEEDFHDFDKTGRNYNVWFYNMRYKEPSDGDIDGPKKRLLHFQNREGPFRIQSHVHDLNSEILTIAIADNYKQPTWVDKNLEGKLHRNFRVVALASELTDIFHLDEETVGSDWVESKHEGL